MNQHPGGQVSDIVMKCHMLGGLVAWAQMRSGSARVVSPYLTAKQAAEYLVISYSTFRKKAHMIRRQPSTGRYRREDLDEFASSMRPKRKRSR